MAGRRFKRLFFIVILLYTTRQELISLGGNRPKQSPLNRLTLVDRRIPFNGRYHPLVGLLRFARNDILNALLSQPEPIIQDDNNDGGDHQHDHHAEGFLKPEAVGQSSQNKRRG